MKEKMEQLKEILFDETPLTGREVLLTITTTFLLGILFGILFSPKKNALIGCNNGNNNVGTFSNDEGEAETEEE